MLDGSNFVIALQKIKIKTYMTHISVNNIINTLKIFLRYFLYSVILVLKREIIFFVFSWSF